MPTLSELMDLPAMRKQLEEFKVISSRAIQNFKVSTLLVLDAIITLREK